MVHHVENLPRWLLDGPHGLNVALWIGASTWKFALKVNAIIITTARLGELQAQVLYHQKIRNELAYEPTS